MKFLVLEVQSDVAIKKCSSIQGWVNTDSCKEANKIIAEKLLGEGLVVISVIECAQTEKDDYFAPCKSLDAFLCAEKDGIAIRYC